jgi:hypothetical protein
MNQLKPVFSGGFFYFQSNTAADGINKEAHAEMEEFG